MDELYSIIMKNYIYLFIPFYLLSCSSKEEKKTEGSESPEKENTEVTAENKSRCYQAEMDCEGEGGGKVSCTLTLTIDGENVTANSNCRGCEGAGEHFYKGVKHEDTLILDETFKEADGAEVITKTFWILSGNQLNQLVTRQKSGKTVLKEQSMHTFLISYLEVGCE